ncbi:MAG TPA: Gfo/Idh/MocA family oxidoreductase [Chthoniobacterales bacterium]
MNKSTYPLRVGLIGAGHISAAYLRAAPFFEQMKIVVCADLNAAAAETRAREFSIESASIEALLEDDSIELVLNLTTPQAHVPVGLRAVEAGKHTYCEKPLGLSVAEARPLLDAARLRGVRVGCAPDTFLGGGQQTARHLIDSGAIGMPIGGTAFILLPGHERWHPNPAFYYQPGGGPVFDMGPYYLTALVNLLGPIKGVVARGSRTFPRRTIGSGPRQGESFPVEVQTHFCALLDFQSGPSVSFNASFDVQGHSHAPIEIYGTEGTLQVPDPNIFGGPVRLLEKNGEWRDVTLTHGFGDRDYRGLGVAEMASAIASGTAHRASDALALHVLEVMEAIVTSGLTGEPETIQSPGERPRPLKPISILGELN